MSTRHDIDSRLANQNIVPQFPRPFDGKRTGPPVLAVNPTLTIGSPNTLDDTILVDDIPRARDKVVCECGGEVMRSYLEKHRLTPKHLALVAAQHNARVNPHGAKQKQKRGDGAPQGLARATASASGTPSAHAQDGGCEAGDNALYSDYQGEHACARQTPRADSDADEYMVPLDSAYFDATYSTLMTNPYHRDDAFIYR